MSLTRQMFIKRNLVILLLWLNGGTIGYASDSRFQSVLNGTQHKSTSLSVMHKGVCEPRYLSRLRSWLCGRQTVSPWACP